MSSKIIQNMDDYSLSGICIRATAARGGGGGGGGTKCGRWNPTSEQVKVLTELFRSGLRTPSTDQIQKIASQLSLYGKIESKNVFYWFQNHKARERQKRRRRVLVDEESQVLDPHHEHHIDPNKLVSSNKLGVGEMNQLVRSESAERVVETLQLFPLNSLSERDDSEKLRLFAEGSNEDNHSLPEACYDYCNKIVGTEAEIIPTLDLRLSSLI